MGSQQSVAGELQGLHEKCVDALAEPSKGVEDAPRLRALLGDVLTAISRLQGVESDDEALRTSDAVSENLDLGNHDEGDEDEDDAIDELAPVDADMVIRHGEVWSCPVRKSTVSHGA